MHNGDDGLHDTGVGHLRVFLKNVALNQLQNWRFQAERAQNLRAVSAFSAHIAVLSAALLQAQEIEKKQNSSIDLLGIFLPSAFYAMLWLNDAPKNARTAYSIEEATLFKALQCVREDVTGTIADFQEKKPQVAAELLEKTSVFALRKRSSSGLGNVIVHAGTWQKKVQVKDFLCQEN